MPAKQDKVAPLLRAFALLERIAAASSPLSTADAVALSGLPKPTIYRLLATLEAAQLVSREPGGRGIVTAPRLQRFALDVMQSASRNGPRNTILHRLAATVGETCNLATLDGGTVVYLDRVESAWPLRMTLQPGSHVPLHCSASGKLLLALLPVARRDRLVEQLALERYTPQTIIDRGEFVRELAGIRQRRIATDDEEYVEGLVCVAVPVMARGRAVASVAIQAPVGRLALSRALQLAPVLQESARALAATF